MGTPHPVFHHTIKKNYKTFTAGWGDRKLTFCSDNFGFRNKCDVINKSKTFDIGIIGDSQTEGLGINFEDTFTHLISKQIPEKNVANLAVASYSPAIYYSKIKFLLNDNFKFNEIIVFLDLSDLHDDTIRYKLEGDKIIPKDANFALENYSLGEKIKNIVKRRLKISNHVFDISRGYLIHKKIIKKPIPHNVEKNFRGSWTYDYDKKWYDNNELADALTNSKLNMNKLYELLREKNIDLSIAVFPWPSTLKYDVNDNLQVKTWREFCKNKCKNFYNFMDPFFDEKNKIGYRNTYLKYYIYGDIHLNENGHKLISDNFFK
tara:strand:- start:2660 stop:3616 length:957 start_codon:yes stop_codon:yes gene_type:complete